MWEETITCGTFRMPNFYEIAEWNPDIQAFDRMILDMKEVNANCCIPLCLSPSCRPMQTFIRSSYQKDHSYV